LFGDTIEASPLPRRRVTLLSTLHLAEQPNSLKAKEEPMARKSKVTQERRVEKLREGDQLLAEMVKATLATLREEARDQYGRMVEEYTKKAAAIGVFGVGSITLAVLDGEVQINPQSDRIEVLGGRAAIYPETLTAISEGRMTVLDAFHRGELVARANSDELHRAYNNFTAISDVAARSPRIREIIAQFTKELDRRTVVE
jgi:hypothetical protein